ncbi:MULTISPECIES: SagB/ThcOx family dehydrogenase [unclassified Hyphomicrobium]|uniref:SagB/ThcOx family dehydrogenase n=1 Tax=unclassified Hyphomicrobium TaxID=2619925 RepID=UPI000213D3CE|nr:MULTISPECIES: SagB/ThcOx family dehydrogenase [unclassified Hyphomicrobium]CCB66851.1 conserved protein of unknown function [Hyphomicrobium sp. MC1]
MTEAATRALSRSETAVAYHARTKHSLRRYASGPETLDWDAQPNPFREFEGCDRVALELMSQQPNTTYRQLYDPTSTAVTPLTIESVASLLELSMALSAWKEQGPDRWALRCNPSSGNLHPTEAYVLSRDVPGLDDGLYHYVCRDHMLERRCRYEKTTAGEARLWIGFSSIHWREAWKYGERAFRYCQLDIGHALGALRYAAAALGWTAKLVDLGSDELAKLMGLDRRNDFRGAESEEADLVLAIEPHRGSGSDAVHQAVTVESPAAQWMGRANVLDLHPLYRWPIIDDVSVATRGRGADESLLETKAYPPIGDAPDVQAATIILNRRSAQRFDPKFKMSAGTFYQILDSLLFRPSMPWDVWDFLPRVHPIFFVHRVEGIEPGVYALPRREAAMPLLRQQLHSDFRWDRPSRCPAHLPFFRLAAADCRAIAKTVSCYQAIASDSCFSLSMLCEFHSIVELNAWRYRQLHWEAGLLGHILYLEAEALGIRGTGIGCFFDDALHELLGLKTDQFQALYHFTVGRPIADTRILTLPPYPARKTDKVEHTA